MKKIYIWGTGYESEKCLTNLNLENCEILGFIETKPDKAYWMDKIVYAPECLPDKEYDYVIIANTYHKEILEYVRQEKFVEEEKIINWIDVKECIYHCEEEAWELFLDEFLSSNFYLFSHERKGYFEDLVHNLSDYKKIYIYDMRLIDCEFDIGVLINEIINNLKNTKIGMAFIPNEELIDIDWYHNLIYVLGKNTFVIWKNLEGIYAEYVRRNPQKISFQKFKILQFKRLQKRLTCKSRYMFYDGNLVYEEKKQLINDAKQINISLLRCDRIGEQIRILNQLMCQKQDKDVFDLYIPIDGYSRPFEGVNTCFNEIVARKFNLLKNQMEYSLWIQDIFEHIEKYQYSGWIKMVNYGNIKSSDMSQRTLTFNEKELQEGRSLIEKILGLSSDYICLFTRDSQYLRSILPAIDCSYHNYRDVSFEVMNKAIDYFDNYGIKTVRMGQISTICDISEKCIDFTNYDYDEFLDLMLHYFSKFFLGCTAGIVMLPMFWNKPTASLTPYYPCIEHNISGGKEDLCIFNRVFSLKEKRELTFIEIFDNAYRFVKEGGFRGEYFKQHNLELIPFSQEDILNIAKEMNEKLDGVWESEDDDIDLHNKFDNKLNIFIKSNNIDISELWMPRVATSYLRKYKYLLEDKEVS